MRGDPERRPAGQPTQSLDQVRIPVLERPGFAAYRHWGLNE